MHIRIQIEGNSAATRGVEIVPAQIWDGNGMGVHYSNSKLPVQKMLMQHRR